MTLPEFKLQLDYLTDEVVVHHLNKLQSVFFLSPTLFRILQTQCHKLFHLLLLLCILIQHLRFTYFTNSELFTSHSNHYLAIKN